MFFQIYPYIHKVHKIMYTRTIFVVLHYLSVGKIRISIYIAHHSIKQGKFKVYTTWHSIAYKVYIYIFFSFFCSSKFHHQKKTTAPTTEDQISCFCDNITTRCVSHKNIISNFICSVFFSFLKKTII